MNSQADEHFHSKACHRKKRTKSHKKPRLCTLTFSFNTIAGVTKLFFQRAGRQCGPMVAGQI